MARHTLIDQYLTTLRHDIRWRNDVADLVHEAEDHLYCAVDQLLTLGVDAHAAQRTTLDRFGDPKVLAVAFASTPSGGIAMPTHKSRRTGTVALVAAAAWLATGVGYGLMTWFDEEWRVFYQLFSVTLLIAGVLTIVTMVGLGRRMGGLGVAGVVAVSITGLALLASVLAWAVFLWMALFGAGLLVFGVAMAARGGIPIAPTLATASGFVLGTIVYVVANLLELGWRDDWGDHPAAWAAGVLVGTLITAVGLVGWGRWLRNEEVPDVDPAALLA